MRIGLIACWLGTLYFQCSPEQAKPKYSHAIAKDFEMESIGDPEVEEGLVMELWAPGPLLKNVVSLDVRDDGVVMVTETARRKSSVLDIRNHWSWMNETLPITTLEESEIFHTQKLATDKSDQNTWLEDFDQNGIHDYRDLMVQSERVVMIEDMDQDGRADRSSVFAEAFHNLLTGVAAGVFTYEGEVYVTVAPDLWKLSDHDSDGIMDGMESISHGYGIHVGYAGHDMSGITMGPDGRLYWSIGDLGVNTIDQTGKRWAYPFEGAVMRCNPDGSDFEVFAHGLRNPQELAFNAYGDLITIDNDGDHAGEHERYVHLLEGSDAGWRIYWQYGKYNNPFEGYKVWTDEELHVPYFPEQAAYIVPALALAPNGPCGLIYNPGPGWGPMYENAFMATFFTGSSANSKVEAFWLAPQGSSYRLEKTKQLIGGIVPTGLDIGPDGALYVVDWKDGYDKKPDGRIFRITPQDPRLTSLNQKIQQLIQLDWKELTIPMLRDHLGHPDMRIRLKAQFELVRRGQSNTFEEVLVEGQTTIPMLHAIWGLGQLARTTGYDCSRLILPLKEDKVEVRCQAARVLGETKTSKALDDLIICLQDTSERVVRFAVEAIGRLGETRAFQPLIQYIENNDLDPALRHTMAFAISRLEAVESRCAQLKEHSNPQVRKVAVLALRHIKSEKIAEFLQDDNSLILNEVARAIHDDESIPGALNALAERLNRGGLRKEEIFLRRSINANLRIGDKESVERLAEFVQNPMHSEDMRVEAMIALGYWMDTPKLDRIEGRPRELEADRDSASVFKVLNQLMVQPKVIQNDQLLAMLLRAAGRLKLQSFVEPIVRWTREKGHNEAVYYYGLEALSSLNSPELEIVFLELVERLGSSGNIEFLDFLESKALADSIRQNLIDKLLRDQNPWIRQYAIKALGSWNPDHQNIKNNMQNLLEGKIDSAILLELLEVARRSTDPKIENQLKQYWELIDTTDIMNRFAAALSGGTPERGASIFEHNPTMTCTQCHSLNDDVSNLAGPNLNRIGNELTRKQLLEALVEPNKRIAPGYGMARVHMNDDTEIVGTVLSEDQDQITLKKANNLRQTVQKIQIKDIDYFPSAMVSARGLLTISEIRDLVAFLESLKE